MWANIDGEKKKVACGPCIRGHRSSKCDHRDRVLIEVRKPGRPLSSCPHPTGSCSCERAVISYSIPKNSGCACPSENALPVLQNNGTGRIQKHRSRKSTATAISPAVLEKVIKAAQDDETDSSSHRTPTSESNNASNPSSASSTPRLLPLQKDIDLGNVESSKSASRPATSQAISSCCKPKLVQAQAGSCCAPKAAPPPQPAPPKKSCCGGSAPPQPVQQQTPQPHASQHYPQHMPSYPPYPSHFQQPPYGMAHPGSNFMQPPPYNFNTPIYNHMASGFQPPVSMPMKPMDGHAAHHNPEHNCHCGDSCSCFGCAAHPNNATMIEYMRSMHQFMSTGQFGAMPPPTYDLPSYPHQAGYGAEANLGFNPIPNYQPIFQPTFNPPMSIPQPPINTPSPWPQTSTPSLTPITQPTVSPFFDHPAPTPTTTSIQPPQPRRESTALTIKSEDQVQSPTFTDSPSEAGKDDDVATLSPSSYFWQEMVLPGCNDETGTCQCGDGCECVGCLTHGGHTGVTLEMPEGDGAQEGFRLLGPEGVEVGEFGALANAPG